MIRVHLGRDGQGSEGSSKKSKLLSQIKLDAASSKQLNRLLTKAGGISTVAFAAAIAFLPHLFIDEYKKLVIKQKEAEIKVAEANLAEMQGQVGQMEPFRRELESFEQQKANVRGKLEIVRKLQSERSGPVNLLDAIGQSLPSQAWIESLEYSDNGTIKLRGLALNNDAISDFTQRLAESIYVGEATINDVTSGVVESVAVREFSLKIRGKMAAATVPAPASKAPVNGGGAAPAVPPPPAPSKTEE